MIYDVGIGQELLRKSHCLAGHGMTNRNSVSFSVDLIENMDAPSEFSLGVEDDILIISSFVTFQVLSLNSAAYDQAMV